MDGGTTLHHLAPLLSRGCKIPPCEKKKPCFTGWHGAAISNPPLRRKAARVFFMSARFGCSVEVPMFLPIPESIPRDKRGQ
jgi:hypothetical protein